MIALARPLRLEKAWHAVSVTLWSKHSRSGLIIGSGELEPRHSAHAFCTFSYWTTLLPQISMYHNYKLESQP
jgi:hypothetical protein